MSSVSPHLQQASMLSALLGKDQAGAFQAMLRTSSGERLAQNSRGICVYQANAAALAERTLASTFPVLAQLIGNESFEPLARYFWRQHPPLLGDMGEWGEVLAEFLESSVRPDLMFRICQHQSPSRTLYDFRRDRKSTRLNSSHALTSRMPSSA